MVKSRSTFHQFDPGKFSDGKALLCDYDTYTEADVKRFLLYMEFINTHCGPGSSVGIATDTGWMVRDEIPVGTRFSARPDRPWGPPSLL